MASELANRYREEGKEDLAEEVESMEREFEILLAEGTGLAEEDLRQMSLATKREIGDAIINGDTTNSETFEYEMSFPVHGGEEPKFNTETVEYEEREPRTYTEEVTTPAPMQDPDEADTETVERKDYRTPTEEVVEWGNEHLNADEVDGDDSDIPAPGEISRERQDRDE